MMQETQLTTSAIATLLHTDIADREISRELPAPNVSLKKLLDLAQMRAVAAKNRLTFRQTVVPVTHYSTTVEVHSVEIQSLTSSSAG
jgi:hypothetical protein